ncbi:uncharacterized protein LOC125746351 [Brienomyrus brachyistius]|uniref:uncharacterized protein LOC125746351 n=1 Tax=Brienomyrus brachyistius TaxID=42636 RepID=UPI0020B24298|nr:uncharacterized protein LOC125746351 [Brienomyrus brachyistius]
MTFFLFTIVISDIHNVILPRANYVTFAIHVYWVFNYRYRECSSASTRCFPNKLFDWCTLQIQKGVSRCHGRCRSNFSSDDRLKSVEDEQEATSLHQDLMAICAKGGFRLNKCVTNSCMVLSIISKADKATGIRNLDLERDARPMERAFQWKEILPAKLILQNLCRLKLGWDNKLPEPFVSQWNQWLRELGQLADFRMNRCIKPVWFSEQTFAQLHHFSDSSEEGYGIASYLLLQNQSAWILRVKDKFIKICRAQNKAAGQCTLENFDQVLTLKELNKTVTVMVSYCQRERFSNEMAALKGQCVKRSSHLYKVSPVLDEGILRVGSRLCHAVMPEESKQPIIQRSTMSPI